MTLETLLVSLGLNISSNLIYDCLKALFMKNPTPSRVELEEELRPLLTMENAYVYNDEIIKFLAMNGDITIRDSTVVANKGILLKSSTNTKFELFGGTCTRTDNTQISISEGGSITGSRGASIEQSEKGIAFSA